MKKIILFSMVSITMFGFYFYNSYETNNYIPFNNISVNQPIPDVMGNICVIDQNGKFHTQNVFSTDSFPVFSGFPKNLPNSTFEGGIVCNMDADADMEIVYNIGYTV